MKGNNDNEGSERKRENNNKRQPGPAFPHRTARLLSPRTHHSSTPSAFAIRSISSLTPLAVGRSPSFERVIR